MDHPCIYCDKANEKYKYDLLKCKKPCKLGKDWKRCQEDLIDIFKGKDVREMLKRK